MTLEIIINKNAINTIKHFMLKEWHNITKEKGTHTRSNQNLAKQNLVLMDARY